MEEQELAIRCARGDNAAWKELYERYGARILALCRRYVSDPADAEDLRQDAFVKIFRVINRFQWTRPGSLYAWMSRVTINLAFDSNEKRRRLAKELVDVDELEGDISDESLQEEAASVPPEVLSAMIAALPEGYRTVFKLYCIDGLSHKDIASLLGIKEKSSSASLSRARALLSDAIREYWKSQEDGTSTEGWSRILRKMHRAAALRACTIATAILLPAASLFLWHSTRQSSAPVIAENTPVVTDEPLIVSDDTTNIRSVTLGRPSSSSVSLGSSSASQGSSSMSLSDSSVILSEANESGSPVIPDQTSPVIPDLIGDLPPEIPPAPRDSVQTVSPASTQKDSQPDAIDPFLTLPDQIRQYRPRFSFSLRAGSGTSRRNTDIKLESTPYVAALTYMNSSAPSGVSNVRSNYSDAIAWFFSNVHEINTSETNCYQHDFPVSMGLTARMEMTPRIGVESGIEYTILHSTVNSQVGQMDQQLHFVGIPVRVDTRLWTRNGLDLYAGLGAKAEKCVAASLGKIACEEPRLQWSAGAFAGVQYRIGPRAHLYFQPDFSYIFTKTELITYRTENPLVFSLNAGLRFDL